MNGRILFVVALLLLLLMTMYSVIEVILAVLFSVMMKAAYSRSDIQGMKEYDINDDVTHF